MSGTPSVQGDQGNYPPTTQNVNDNPTVETPKGNKRTLTPNRDSVMNNAEATVKGGRDLTSAIDTKPRIISFITRGATALSKGIQNLWVEARKTAIQWERDIKKAVPRSIFGNVKNNPQSTTIRNAKEIHSEMCSKDPGTIKTEVKLGDMSLKSTCTPQASLSGFSDGIKFYSSELGSKEHISNLWRHDIEVGGKSVSFVRSGSTRGNEQATKELLANAVALQYDINALPNNATVYLDLSNIQLMTPVGKIGDGEIPLKQMEALWDLYAKGKETAVNYNGKTINVQLPKPPLLFDFGVNVQHFRMGKLAHSKEIDNFNKRGFIQLFGKDPRESYKLSNETPYYSDISLVGRFLKSDVSDDKKGQVKALANQIATILQEHPNGIESNPYALPVRVMLLTNLLGCATTYGCKSGKDRTGVCAMELEALAAKMLSTNELYDPEKPSAEEKDILQQIYLKGEAIKMAQTNKEQNNLTVPEMLGFNSLQERFGVKLKRDFSENLDKLYVNEGNRLYKELSKKISELKPLSDADNQIGKLARGEKESPEIAKMIAKEINEGKYGEQVKDAFAMAKQKGNAPDRKPAGWEERANLADISKALYEGIKKVKQLETIRSQVALLTEGAKNPNTMDSEKLSDIKNTLEKQGGLAQEALEYLGNFPPHLLGNEPTPPSASSLEISKEKEILDKGWQLLAESQKLFDQISGVPSGQNQILDESPALPPSSETSVVQTEQASNERPVSITPKSVKALNKSLAQILNEAYQLGVTVHVTKGQADKEVIPSEPVAPTQASALASEAQSLPKLVQPIQESNETLVEFLGKFEDVDYLDNYAMHDLRMMFMSVNVDKKSVDNLNEVYEKLGKKIKSLTNLSRRLDKVGAQITGLSEKQARENNGEIIAELENFSEVSKTAKSKIDDRLEKMNYILSEVKWLKEYTAESSYEQKKIKRLEKKSEWLKEAIEKIKNKGLSWPRDEKLEQDTLNEIYNEATTRQAWESAEFAGQLTNPLRGFIQGNNVRTNLVDMHAALGRTWGAVDHTLKERK